MVKTAIKGRPIGEELLWQLVKLVLDVENLNKIWGVYHNSKWKIFFYNESEIAEYMRNDNIEINVNISCGSKNFVTYTMDFTKKYIEINADYRS